MALGGIVRIAGVVDVRSVNKTLSDLKKNILGTFSKNDTKAFEQSIKQTEKTIQQLEKKIETAKQKLDELMSSGTPPKSVQNMEKELKTLQKSLDEEVARLKALSVEYGEIMSKTIKEPNGNIGFATNKDKARAAEIETLMKSFGATAIETGEHIKRLKSKLEELKANPELTEEAQKYQKEIDRSTQAVDRLRQKQEELRGNLKNAGSSISNSFNNASNSVSCFDGRIAGLIKNVFIFSVIPKALRSLSGTFGAAIMSNKQFSNSLAQIKGNLLTAFMPIYQTVLPALQALMNVLAKVTAYIAAFISLLTGKSVSASQQAAKAFYNQANAVKAAGSGAKKAAKDTAEAAKEAEKSTLAFDELNTISSQKDTGADTGTAGGGSGGGGGDGVSPFQASDLSFVDAIQEKMKGILVLVGLIGGALLAWKITDFIASLIESSEKLELFKSGFGKLIGIAAIVAGGIMAIKNYSDAWVDGIGWGNFLSTISGLALLITGIALVISPAAAAFAAMGAGIALVVLGIKDFLENGESFQNVLTILIGLATIFAATWLLAGAPIAIIVTAIAALIAIFVLLWNKCEGFRNFWTVLWEDIKQAAKSVWDNFLKPIIDALGVAFMNLWNNHIKPFWEEHFKPALVEIGNKFKELWITVIQPVIQLIGEKVNWLWNEILSPLVGWIAGAFQKSFIAAFITIGDMIGNIFNTMGGIIDSIKTYLSGVVDFIIGVFTGDWERAFQGLVNIAKGILNGLVSIVEGIINGMITALNGFTSGLNSIVSTIGDVLGQSWNIPTIPKVKLPRLAQGAVLPPNREFLAVLGDQKNGKNLEAPEGLFRQIVSEELAKSGYTGNREITINFTGNLAQLARILKPQLDKETNRRGVKLVTGGAY